MKDKDVALRLPTLEGEILNYPDKCGEVDAEGRIIHTPFCGLSEKLSKGENIWGNYMEITIGVDNG